MTLSLRLLAGCGLAILAGSAALAQTELRITHAMSSGAGKEAFDMIVANFEAANPGVTVNQIVFDDDIYSDTGLITQLQSNEVPDIYFQWAGYPVGRDVEAGYAYDLTAAMADGWQATFIDSAFSAGAGTTVDGKVYMVPLSLDITNTIWYNTAIFAEYGLTPPATWDEFVAAITVLAEAGETPIIEGNNELWPLGNWASHVAARVVDPVKYDAAFRQEISFADAGFLPALELMQQLHEVGAFNVDMQGLGADPAMAGFFQEAAVMHPIGSWLVGSEGDLAEEGFAYSQFDTPLIDPNHPAPDSVIGTITGFVMHAQSTHPDEAVAFLKFLTSPESQVIWAEAGAISPVKGVGDVANLNVQMKGIGDMLANAGTMIPPPDTTYPVPVAEAYYQAAAYAASGEKSAADALVWLDETVTAMGKQ
jgi:raffinose/stachyose/melibiose transport system substrate-binding protein